MSISIDLQVVPLGIRSHSRAALPTYCAPGAVTQRWAGQAPRPLGAEAIARPEQKHLRKGT